MAMAKAAMNNVASSPRRIVLDSIIVNAPIFSGYENPVRSPAQQTGSRCDGRRPELDRKS
ncbi:MAG: hypothetical protein ABW217_00780 [Polyangiaceae bacterium]